MKAIEYQDQESDEPMMSRKRVFDEPNDEPRLFLGVGKLGWKRPADSINACDKKTGLVGFARLGFQTLRRYEMQNAVMAGLAILYTF